ncbi:MAG: ABC transporter permease [Pseudonocardiaceae bacterium]
MLLAQGRTEFVLTLRNGEQVLLTLLIPLGLLIGLTILDVVPMPDPRVDSVTPRILALAVMSTAFTGQAIALGFDRRYGVLKRLAATALPRWSLVAGRMLAVLGVVAVQLMILGVVAAVLGWRPEPAGIAFGVLLVLAGTAAFGALGVLLGGTLRAEVVLAVANMVWLALVVAGGIVLSVDTLPGPLSVLAAALPSGALAEGLHAALVTGATPWGALGVLLAWTVGAGGLAARTLRLS